MKIRTRLAIAFVTITVVPIVLIFVAAFGLVNYQEHLFQKTYGAVGADRSALRQSDTGV